MKYLKIYLNDHLMGSTTGVELVRRIADGHEGEELGTFAAALAEEIEADRDALLDIMRTLDASRDQVKVAAGWIAEKVGRLKLNGELRGSSPLSPVVELEGLSMGIEGKRLLWVALAETEGVAQRVGAERLQKLIERAEQQREGVERRRREAARRAFTA
ncbi:MAG: hypothetical protein H0T69_10905 [Thermoleophilaceae bacterium]|nr:hypothetical protein [Thermoleophilaceae bacterium]